MASKPTRVRVCVLKCRINRHMHRFPKDEVGKSVWLKQLGLKHINPSSFVCDHHFSDKMKPNGVGIKLTPWAIPDINLPVRGDSETDEDDYYEDEQFKRVMTPISKSKLDQNKAPDTQMNGHSTKDDKPAENNNSDPLDFDDVLAKVHCIADLTNNNNRNNRAISVTDDDFSMDEERLNNEDDSDDNDSEKIGNERLADDENTFSSPSTPVEISSKYKRKLIASVRKRRVLYDPAHPSFGNIARKKRSWERIGKIQRLDATACRELWLSLRYDYQNHVRNLRQWLAGESNQHDRPRIPFENDLLFLWRYVSDKSYCDEAEDEDARPTRNVILHVPVAVAESPNVSSSRDVSVANIDYARAVDHPYAHNDSEESLQFPCKLIDTVQPYSELYDILHPNYGDVKRKSIIWDAIANELNEKVTKCLYTWIQLQLRYEFEVMHDKSSYLVNKLDFLKKHILPNEKSLFKRIAFPTVEWHGTMNGYKDQHLIIESLVTSKKYRTFLFNIDLPYAVEKRMHIPCWTAIGKTIKRKAEKCELTWIVMQAMYCEVSEFRKHDCLLRDEWEFEAIITNLLANLPSKKLNKIRKDEPLASVKKNAKRNATETIAETNADTNDEPIPEAMDYDDIYEPGQLLTLPSEPNEKPNEIKFTIPSQGSGEPLVGAQLLRYTLDKPVAELDEKTIVDIDSIMPGAHILILRRYKKSPAVFPFTLDQRKELIAEVMARPLLFNEPCKQARLNRVFWGEISIEIGYPADPCMYFWEYIMEKFLFLDYDPSWKKSEETKWIPPPNPIFDKFQKYADSKCWGDFISVLPEFIQEISNFPLVYVDLKVNSTWNRRQCHARDIAEVWTILSRKFAVLDNHKLIWDKFKQLFLNYMAEIELSIYNVWPKFWFPVLEKMTFLYELRYNPKQPIYYVIKNKIQDEINQYRRGNNPRPIKLDAVTNGKAIFGLLKENEYLDDFTWVNRARFLAKMKTFPMLYDINHSQFGTKEAKLDAWQEMALSFHCTVGECHLIFQHLLKSFLLFRARDPNQLCRVNAKYWENMTYIYSCAVPNSIDPKFMEWRSFRAASNGSTIKLAEEFQAEISLVDAKPRLILKNVAAAVNSLPIQIQNTVVHQLKHIFSEYSRGQGEDIVVDV